MLICFLLTVDYVESVTTVGRSDLSLRFVGKTRVKTFARSTVSQFFYLAGQAQFFCTLKGAKASTQHKSRATGWTLKKICVLIPSRVTSARLENVKKKENNACPAGYQFLIFSLRFVDTSGGGGDGIVMLIITFHNWWLLKEPFGVNNLYRLLAILSISSERLLSSSEEENEHSAIDFFFSFPFVVTPWAFLMCLSSRETGTS